MATQTLSRWLKDTMARQLALFDEPTTAAPLDRIAPDPSPQLPLLSLSDAIAPTVFVHPQANRHLNLQGTPVSFVLKRGKRKTIGFSVGPDGLAVSAPKYTPLGEIDSALRNRADWIVSKLGLARERANQRLAQRIEWKDGATLPFLGEPVVLHLDARHAWGKSVDGQAQFAPSASPSPARLSVGLAADATPEQIRDAVQAWLMRQAKRIFAERLMYFEQQLGVRHTRLKLSSADTRWGSASGDGTIRLNWRLVHFPMHTIDYVVVHELSHLRVMDHSPQFWGVVGSVMPDYAQRRAQLKGNATPTWS